MNRLVDDQILGQVLRSEYEVAPGVSLFTTGLWYVRLCQAVVSTTDRLGTLSRPFTSLTPEARARALDAVSELPASIGLVSLRTLGPLIGKLRQTHHLNALAMEILASASHLDAEVHLSAASPRLETALRDEGFHVRSPP